VAGAKGRSSMAGCPGCPTALRVGVSISVLPQAGLGESQRARGQAEMRAAAWPGPQLDAGTQQWGDAPWSCSPSKDVSHRAQCVYKEDNLVSFTLG